MANRSFAAARYSLEKNVVDLWAKFTIGASGAPTLVAASSKGFGATPLVRNSAGDYTLTLQDVYNRFLNFRATFQSATGIPAAPSVGLKGAPTTSVIAFVCSTAGAGAATDPGSGEVMWLHVTMSNSSAP